MSRIIFMGTPDFSVPALAALAARQEFEICLVVTQPDRPKGRGKKLSPSPVKKKAAQLGLDVYQPEKLNTAQGIDRLCALDPDYFVVVAFGQILSQAILDIPKVYPINIHASLLPKYRGASPIQAAVMNMDKETGVTTMVMARGMDTGDMLLTSRTPVDPDETAEDLHDRLSAMGADLIVETITRINQGNILPAPQNDACATYVPMLKKSDGIIDWNRSPDAVRAHINAMTPWPGAFTELNGNRLKVFKATPASYGSSDSSDSDDSDGHQPEPGQILACSREGIHTAVGGGGSVMITQVMGTSGKRMTADAFIRGNPIDLPARFQGP